MISQEKYRKLRASYCEDICYDANTGPCGWISGCLFILRAEAFHQAGMFDPYTFLYAEEPILSRRLELAGYSVWFCKEIKVIHRHAQTTKNAISRLKIFELDFQSIYYYYKTYTDTPNFVLLLARLNFTLYKLGHKLWYALKSLRSGRKDL
jgi:GT2 family glycosyltransferase